MTTIDFDALPEPKARTVTDAVRLQSKLLTVADMVEGAEAINRENPSPERTEALQQAHELVGQLYSVATRANISK